MGCIFLVLYEKYILLEIKILIFFLLGGRLPSRFGKIVFFFLHILNVDVIRNTPYEGFFEILSFILKRDFPKVAFFKLCGMTSSRNIERI